MDAVTLKLPASGQIRSAPNKRKLTDLKVASLKPKGRAYTVWDAAQRGLGLRIQVSGYKSWIVVYRDRGKQHWLTFPLVPVQAAREKAMEVTLALLRGQDPAPERNVSHVIHFSTLAQRYVEQHSSKKNKSWKHADKLVRRYLLPSWEKVDAAAITRADVRTVISKISAPALANQVRLAASAIFTWAVSQDLVQHNPCTGIEGTARASRERILSDAEVRLFIAAFRQAETKERVPGPSKVVLQPSASPNGACDQMKRTGRGVSSNAGRACMILLLTGQRPGEVARMRHEHIKDGWWEMPGKPDGTGWRGTKNGLSHRVWLVPAARDQIGGRPPISNEGRKTGQPVFAEDQKVSQLTFSGPVFKRRPAMASLMQRLCKELNVERATPHDLRRTFASTVTKLGFGRPAMDRLLNHADRSVGSVYDRYGYSAEDQQIWTAVAEHLLVLSR
jgi:integrase